MQISVVIPTCNRKTRLLSLLHHLHDSVHPIREVIIVDSGEDRLLEADYADLKKLEIIYIGTEKSVCIQRNTGIRRAASPLVLLCDDDIEIRPDYIDRLAAHLRSHPEAVAVSGLWLQKEKGSWKASYPENSALQLCWKFIFGLGIWGEITCNSSNPVIRKIKQHYKKKGNHISRAGWPVLTDFSGDYFRTPLYSLGASLVRKEWLLRFPFDEVLDRFGMGDNYGVAINFPPPGIHVLNHTPVFHQQEPANRLQKPLQYFRRVLALDYFVKNRQGIQRSKRIWLLWSLVGNLLNFIRSGNKLMIAPALKSIWIIATKRNPYHTGARRKQKIVEPRL